LCRNDPAAKRLNLVVAGALFLVGIGALIDQGLAVRSHLGQQSRQEYELSAGPLLRYYWFRLADVLLPAGAALAAVLGIHRLHGKRPGPANWLLVAAILVAGGDLATVCYQRARLRISGSAIQERRTDLATQAHWRSACEWIAANTPQDAKFITPRQQQTFKWYAGRAEVATWKDLPQDASSIVAWRRARTELYPNDIDHLRHDLAAFSDEELVALARKHGASYLLIDRTTSSRLIGLPKVYPDFTEENPAFAVYRVPAKMAP
jgi:hypothetical protein